MQIQVNCRVLYILIPYIWFYKLSIKFKMHATITVYCVISGLHRGVNEICVRLGYYVPANW